MRTRDLTAANVVFIGGSGGIGLAAAVEVAARGADVLLVGRDRARGERASAAVSATNGPGEVSWVQGDVSSIAGVDAVAARIRAWRPVLHGLVHSAMHMPTTRAGSRVPQPSRSAARRRAAPARFRHALTDDGFEWAFGLQYLARYALNRALVDLLARSGDGRIVHVGAKVRPALVPELDDLQFARRRWSLLRALMSSQVLGHLHVQEAARRWHDQPVSATVVCVGPTRTETTADQALWIRALYRAIATTPQRSARNVVRVLTAADARPVDGTALRHPRRFAPTRLAYDAALARDVWDLSDRLARERGLSLA